MLSNNKIESSHEDVAYKFMRESIPDEEETKKLYFELIQFVRKIFGEYKSNAEINRDDIANSANKIVNHILLGSRGLLKLCHELNSLELYLYYNAVNVSILAVEIGVASNYNKSALSELAIAGLLHDIDFIKIGDIINKPGKLSEDEVRQLRRHPVNGAAFAGSTLNLNNDIVTAILQHHERVKGYGYPAGLTENDIREYAMVIAIADSYEARTHSRPYREKVSAHNAVMSIIKSSRELYTNAAVKALVSSVGLYPVGSWVELNTGEICKVVEVNHDWPLRPVVVNLMDKNKNKLKEVKVLDLRKNPSIYIEKSVLISDD